MSDIQNELMAQRFHENLRNLAPDFRYETLLSEQACKPWHQTAASHRRLLSLVMASTLAPLNDRIANLELRLADTEESLSNAQDVIRYGGTWTPNNKDE